MSDLVLAAVADAGAVIARVADTTQLCEEARCRNGAAPTAAAALARALTGAVLMGSFLERGQSVRLRWQSDGPLGSVAAEGRGDLAARARVENPAALKAPATARGVLRVVTELSPTASRCTSVPCEEGNVGEDLARYYGSSEQIPSVVALGVRLDEGGRVEQAGGLVVLGGSGNHRRALGRVEENLSALGAPCEEPWQALGVEGVARRLFQGAGHRRWELGTPRHFCTCSAERVSAALRALGSREFEELRREAGEARLRCDACGFEWRVAI